MRGGGKAGGERGELKITFFCLEREIRIQIRR